MRMLPLKKYKQSFTVNGKTIVCIEVSDINYFTKEFLKLCIDNFTKYTYSDEKLKRFINRYMKIDEKVIKGWYNGNVWTKM